LVLHADDSRFPYSRGARTADDHRAITEAIAQQTLALLIAATMDF